MTQQKLKAGYGYWDVTSFPMNILATRLTCCRPILRIASQHPKAVGTYYIGPPRNCWQNQK